MTKDDFIIKRVWESSGGGEVHEREKVEQNEAWKSLLPSIAPGWTHPPRLWQYWHQGEPTKSFLVVVCGQYFRKYGKNVIKKPFRFSFIFKTVESLGGETGGRSWSWNWAGGGAQVCGFDNLIIWFVYVSHCSGRHFRTKLMSRYIGVGPNDRFDVRIQELVSKAKNPGGFLRKNVF